MTGAGEHVEPLPGEKPPLIVVPLDAELSAAAVYRAYDEHFAPRADLDEAAARIRAGEMPHVNDLEGPAKRSARRSSPRWKRSARRGSSTRWSAAPAPRSSASPPIPTRSRRSSASTRGRRAHEVDLARRRRRARRLADRPPPQAEALVPGRRADRDRGRRPDRLRGHPPAELREGARGRRLGARQVDLPRRRRVRLPRDRCVPGVHRPGRDRGAGRRARRRPGRDQPVRADRDRLGLLPGRRPHVLHARQAARPPVAAQVRRAAADHRGRGSTRSTDCSRSAARS